MASEVFTPDEVVALDAFQRDNRGLGHPFTCPNRGDGNHRVVGGDLGALFPTVFGWVCPFCTYQQNWAHDSMKRFKPPEVAGPSAYLIDPELAAALLDCIDQLRDGLTLALDCTVRDIKNLTRKKGPPDAASE